MANTEKFIFSSESVTERHPDKVADQIFSCLMVRTISSMVAAVSVTLAA